MTKEEAQALIEKGAKEGNTQMVEEGLAALKEAESDKTNFISPIVRKEQVAEKNYGKREPIKIANFNMFEDDGDEHAIDKLAPDQRGKWRVHPRSKAVTEIDIECGVCGKAYKAHPSLWKKPEYDEVTGKTVDRNICDNCILHRKRQNAQSRRRF